MADWIKKAARNATSRAAHTRERDERARRNIEAIHIQAPRIWDEIKKELKARVDEFNAEFMNDSLSVNPVSFGVPSSGEVLISTVQKPNGSFIALSLFFEPGSYTVDCKIREAEIYTTTRKPPDSLRFYTFTDGNVTLGDGQKPITVPAFVEMILNWVFDGV